MRVLAALSLLTGACSASPSVPSLGRPVAVTGPTTTLGRPVEATTATPVPFELALTTTTSLASWYAHGTRTAWGTRFNPDEYTAAHRLLPFGTRVLVNHGGRSIVAVINDRGPYTGGRDLDLSRAAFLVLAPLSQGVISVEWTVLP